LAQLRTCFYFCYPFSVYEQTRCRYSIPAGEDGVRLRRR
jgi:hypothetical protein